MEQHLIAAGRCGQCFDFGNAAAVGGGLAATPTAVPRGVVTEEGDATCCGGFEDAVAEVVAVKAAMAADRGGGRGLSKLWIICGGMTRGAPPLCLRPETLVCDRLAPPPPADAGSCDDDTDPEAVASVPEPTGTVGVRGVLIDVEEAFLFGRSVEPEEAPRRSPGDAGGLAAFHNDGCADDVGLPELKPTTISVEATGAAAAKSTAVLSGATGGGGEAAADMTAFFFALPAVLSFVVVVVAIPPLPPVEATNPTARGGVRMSGRSATTLFDESGGELLATCDRGGGGASAPVAPPPRTAAAGEEVEEEASTPFAPSWSPFGGTSRPLEWPPLPNTMG